MAEQSTTRFVGRATNLAPPNRFVREQQLADFEQLAADDELLADERAVPTVFLPDRSATLIRENDSPDIPFRFSINPYRGCEHGCAYCYARPTHETLGMNAGLDFETIILVKHDAVELLRKELNRKGWTAEPIMMSGVTDCYQPAERQFRLTRGILEVLFEAHQPVCLITKNSLVCRDIDILAPLAERRLVGVAISITTLDAELARTLEPRTATPAARLRAIRELSAAGVSVRAMVAPIIPGLNDAEIPAILSAAKEAGACGAGHVMLRLPLNVAPVFMHWLQTHRPLAAERIESLIRAVRGGKLNDARFGSRMSGSGPYADGIEKTFDLFVHKLGLDAPSLPLDSSQFRPPRLAGGQLRLF
ncbi:MAG: PA0069 family radical SAM protein [Planctomycetaceae bacterium]|nr:PA0069 family radical SAM protein [Planctomycetaceae bacterium]